MAMLLALAIVLAFVEAMVPPLPFLPPGVKLGLSNIVTMYTLFFLDTKAAYTVGVLKSGFVFLTRGFTGFCMSLCGGLFSITAMALALLIGKKRLSYLVISICGAVFHNIGQLLMAGVLMGSHLVVYYTPVILISGVIMGIITGVTLRLVMPAIDHVNRYLH